MVVEPAKMYNSPISDARDANIAYRTSAVGASRRSPAGVSGRNESSAGGRGGLAVHSDERTLTGGQTSPFAAGSENFVKMTTQRQGDTTVLPIADGRHRTAPATRVTPLQNPFAVARLRASWAVSRGFSAAHSVAKKKFRPLLSTLHRHSLDKRNEPTHCVPCGFIPAARSVPEVVSTQLSHAAAVHEGNY